MEARKEIDDVFNDVADLKCKAEYVDESTERLEGICNAIRKYGICRSMMIAADPKRELVAAGICAYEELSDKPLMDKNAESSIELIEVVLFALFAVYVIFFKKVSYVMEELYKSSTKTSEKNEVLLRRNLKRLENIKVFDNNKFVSHPGGHIFSKDTFEGKVASFDSIIELIDTDTLITIVKNLQSSVMNTDIGDVVIKNATAELNSYLSKFKGKDEDIFNVLLIKPPPTDDNISESIVEVERKESRDIRDTHDSINPSKRGWCPDDAKDAITSALHVLRVAEVLYPRILEMSVVCREFSKTLKIYSQKGEELSQGKKDRRKQIVLTIKHIVYISQQVFLSVVTNLHDICDTANHVAEAAIKSKI